MRILEPRIRTFADLTASLQRAIELEHATIPLYLTAQYSLAPGAGTEIASLIQGVVIEEMLHFALACNVLNAIGGRPAIDRPGFVPTFPGPLPMGVGSQPGQPFMVHLKRFSQEQVRDTFMVIEEPEEPIDVQALVAEETTHYRTIGEFYTGIRQMIETLGQPIFTGDPSRQLTNWFDGRNDLISVTDVESAVRAIDLIIRQGEGTQSSPLNEEGQLSHYYRFAEVNAGRHLVPDRSVPGGWSFTGPPIPFDPARVYPMADDPKTSTLPEGSLVRMLSEEFNRTYSNLLAVLHSTFNGDPARLDSAMGLMYSLKVQAQKLMETRIVGQTATAGPAFEYVRG